MIVRAFEIASGPLLKRWAIFGIAMVLIGALLFGLNPAGPAVLAKPVVTMTMLAAAMAIVALVAWRVEVFVERSRPVAEPEAYPAEDYANLPGEPSFEPAQGLIGLAAKLGTATSPAHQHPQAATHTSAASSGAPVAAAKRMASDHVDSDAA